MKHRLDEKLHLASSAYEDGATCVQAVLSAYTEELGISDQESLQVSEKACSGIGTDEGRCGVIEAASAIAGMIYSGGPLNADTIAACPYTQKIEQIFGREYGGTTCRKILKGRDPASGCCEMKVKDMILVIEQLTGGMDR